MMVSILFSNIAQRKSKHGVKAKVLNHEVTFNADYVVLLFSPKVLSIQLPVVKICKLKTKIAVTKHENKLKVMNDTDTLAVTMP